MWARSLDLHSVHCIDTCRVRCCVCVWVEDACGYLASHKAGIKSRTRLVSARIVFSDHFKGYL